MIIFGIGLSEENNMNKMLIKKQYGGVSLLFRIFLDPLIAWGLANWLGSTVESLEWLQQFGYWAWVGIVLLIQTLWGTDTPNLVVNKYKTFKEQLKEK